MRYAWKQTAAPSDDPLTYDDIKEHLREVADDETLGILRRIKSATRQTEEYLGRGLLAQTWQLAQDDFTNEIWLPRAAPLQSITSFQYYDESGTLQTVDSDLYLIDDLSEPARIVLAPTQTWPVVQADRPLAVIVTYVVGWASPDDIPPDILDAIALRVGTRHEHREGVLVGNGLTVNELPDGIEALLAPHRVFWREPVCVS